MAPGALVQIDTLTINPVGERTIKRFTGYDPVARFTDAQAFKRATSPAAAQFLDHLQGAVPFPLCAIQVDDGSEFIAAFETACAAKGLELYILPPKSPEMNGAVERANGALRYEFYACYELPHRLDDLNQLIDGLAHLYNHVRPKLPPPTFTLTASETPLSH